MNQEAMRKELGICPCGKIPTEIGIQDANQGGKWAYAIPDCCGEWMIEFRTDYAELDSVECIESAKFAWNTAPREAIKAQADKHQSEIAALQQGRTNHGDESNGAIKRFAIDATKMPLDVIPATNGAFVWYDDYIKQIAEHQAEIAELKEALQDMIDFITGKRTTDIEEAMRNAEQALSTPPTQWLAERDAKIRAEQLEKIDCDIELFTTLLHFIPQNEAALHKDVMERTHDLITIRNKEKAE